MRAPRRLAPALVLVTGSLALAPVAHAIYGPASGGTGAEIVSVDNATDEQANAATTDAAISGDGRYVVFQTDATNLFEDDGETEQEKAAAEPPGTLREGGIFRYDRATGELRIVASGNLVVSEGPEAGKLLVRGAESPSISEEGRYVDFSTAQQLVPQDTNKDVDVYVRDMDRVPGEAGAYTLVSAKSGGDEPASYAAREPQAPGGNPGAEVWPNSAISANGRYVVFRTPELASDLPDQTAIETPAGQLFVRDLQARTTTLVSRDSEGGGPAGGAVGPVAISADGSTVSWVSTNAPAQTRFLAGEVLDENEEYYLWQRWQQPGALTRRITGITDPEDPECPPDGSITLDPTATGPCYGPLTYPEAGEMSIAGAAPALSADGYTVAFLASGALRPDIVKPGSLDVFLTSMSPGVTRKAGTRELTLAASGSGGRSSAPVESLALSADGSTIAFTSRRDLFVLPEPAPLGSFRPQPTERDLYVINLKADTLERAVLSYEGEEPDGSVFNYPTLTANGSTVAFVSDAANMIYGDANGASDAFTATLQAPTGTGSSIAGTNVGQGGFSLTGAISQELGVNAKRGKSGEVLLLVETPGPGKLTAQARGRIPTASTAKATARKAVSFSSKAKKHSAGKKKSSPPVVLARATANAPSEGTTTLTLHLTAKYLKDLKYAGKLEANVMIDFTPPAPAQALSDEVSVTFTEGAASKKAAARSSKSKRGDRYG